MSVRRPSPDRLVLRGHGPLAGLLATLLVIALAVPSRSDAGDAAEVAVGAPDSTALVPTDDAAAVVLPAAPGAAVAAPTKAASAASRGTAATPAAAAAAA